MFKHKGREGFHKVAQYLNVYFVNDFVPFVLKTYVDTNLPLG